ncbi:MAG: radical SAM protein [Lachnospiraceae bacterium]|nr:radical SAM protein [Lachnospiraceae bacterium]
MKAYSSLKIFHHKDYLDAIEKNEIKAPIYIRLKPTNFCNHHCSYCTYGSGNTDNRTTNRDIISHTDVIPWNKLQEILFDFIDMGVKAITFSGGGEPLTYPHIVDAVNLVNEGNMSCSLISNGQLLCGEIAEAFYGAKWVRISFDSPIEEEYCRIRRVSPRAFNMVCDNLRSFSRNKSTDCTLGVNFVVSKDNFRHVYRAAELLRELGVNNIKFAAVVSNTPNYHEEICEEVIEQIKSAKKDFESDVFQIINNYEGDCHDKQFLEQPFKRCFTCKLVSVVGADQKVYLCHTRAYDEGAVIGDLKSMSFKQLWFSDATRRKLDLLDPVESCRNFCAYQDRNEMINAYFDIDYNHLDFI